MMNAAQTTDSFNAKEFATIIAGRVILPEDPDYEKERRVYNAMINKYPAIIVKCADVADVISCVRFAKNNGLVVAVRSGGHNAGGLGICDGGLVIDLSGIKSVRVDPDERTVTVGGGNILAEIDHATHAFGLAVPAGIISTTGIGGLALGGGIGYLSRKYGLTVDNLLEADMVLADGTFRTVSAYRDSDLFWAIRGGGGNFGIVTSFTFRAHPVKNVIAGPTLWPIEQTPEIMAWYDAFIHDAPEELNGFFVELVVPGPPFPEPLHHKKFCGVVWCFLGSAGQAEEIFKPVSKLNPVFQHVGEMPFPSLQKMFDGMFPPGLQWYWRADFFPESVPEARQKHLQYGLKIPTPLSQMHLYPVSGRASRPGSDETPWAYRNAKYAGVVLGVDPDPANAGEISQWCKDYWQAIHPFSAGGAYTNFMMEEGQDRVRASFKDNYERLQKVKKRYDPGNFFKVNQNVIPA